MFADLMIDKVLPAHVRSKPFKDDLETLELLVNKKTDLDNSNNLKKFITVCV